MDRAEHLTPPGGAGLAADPDFARHTYLVIDFEALTPAGRPPAPTEVAALALEAKNGELVEVWRFQALIRPPREVPVTDFDVRQTGITAAMLAQATGPEHVMAALDALLTAPPYRLIAHHAATEAGLIAHQGAYCPALAAVPLLDTVRLARLIYPELSSHSLDALLRYLRIPIPADRHRAMPDVEATAQVLRRMLAENTTARRWTTLHAMDAAAGLPPKRLPAAEGAQEGLF
ncbi:3'-5' exonuclease [Planomonospora sp. ID91781]|uniref:3'-5' exonuclease n=1 Tax=Planomonospora sp. ID91781 TaxID=2738135 RepID=UPI0018C428DD|nr:3'-5' exonuclease [Planomonospora sp. ID91781]MBG0825715.1 3'-5' exonuclease [Planomonospora sp. ID91781]